VREVDWNRAIVLGAQAVVVIVLGACVIAGKDSYITDGLLAVSGSITGVGLLGAVSKKKPQG
jgi:hypothetical protein